MKTLSEQPSQYGADQLGVNVTGLDRRMGPDDAAVHDALCVLGAPTGTGCCLNSSRRRSTACNVARFFHRSKRGA